MQPNPSIHSSSAGEAPGPADCTATTAAQPCGSITPRQSLRRCRAVTLVEAMVALMLMAAVMLGFIGSFIQSRRVTEASVLHAAATSLVYGIVEQIKGLDYVSLLPSTVDDVDPDNPTVILGTAPFVRARLNQDKTVWLRTVYTPAIDPVTKAFNTPKAPTTTPAITATSTSVGAEDNFIGSLPLSTVTGTTSQQLALNIWVWIDELKPTNDVTDVKKITLVYTYSYMDGSKERIIRDREVFLRTRFDQ